MRWIANDDTLVLFFELTDEQLDRVSKDKDYIYDGKFVNTCHKAKGDNAHIITIYNNGNKKFFYQHFKNNPYKSISWWNKIRTKFYIRRLKCHN